MDKNGACIDLEKCIGCGRCAKNCASEAIVKIEI
jgi:ferredoxin